MITQDEFLEQILGFSKPWFILEVIQKESEIAIKLDYPKGTYFKCPHCGKEVTAHDTKWKEYRHLDWWQYKTFIKVKVPRIKCCKKTETVEIPWLRKGSKFTQMMESHILKMVKTGSISKISKLLRITDTRIWRVVQFWVNKHRDKAVFSEVYSIGIDETSKKGHSYITNFVDLEKRKVMFVANGKDSKTINDFKSDFKRHKGDPDSIKNITSDMSLAFEKGINKNFKNGKIIIDKFHVIKYFNDALNMTLRDDIKAGRNFKKSKYIWAKNPENLTQKQKDKFRSMNKQHSKTAKAYQMKLVMQEIYNLTDKTEAEKRLNKLISWMKRSRNVHMKKLAKTILNHWNNILNYFDDRLTNAILEGINNIIQNIKHTARGF